MWLYDSDRHCLLVLDGTGTAPITNRSSTQELTGARYGTVLQLAADVTKTRAGYEHADSLILRDAGALTATFGLCAAWLGLTACSLGRLGDSIVVGAGLPGERFVGVGAILVGDQPIDGGAR